MKNFRTFLATLVFAATGSVQAKALSVIVPAPGQYTLALKIGDRLFNDKLVIASVTSPPQVLMLPLTFSGTFISPEGHFQSTVLNGTLRPLGKKLEMTFDILVEENGQKYSVYFQASGVFSNSTTNTGVAYLDADKTQELGKFTLSQDISNCDHGQ